jgi:hypothetical protein
MSQPRQELEAKIHALITEKYLDPRYRRIVAQNPRDLVQYDAMLRPMAQSNLLRPGTESIISQIADAVLASDNPYPLCVSGKPGRGKSSFLSLLYLWLRNLRSNNPTLPIPFYINIKAYYGHPFDSGRPETEEEFSRDTEPLARLFEEYPDNSAIFLIDGLDEYLKVADPIEGRILEIIRSNDQRARKIVGVGLNYVADRERFRRDLFHLGDAADVLVLGEVALDSEGAVDFCAAVQRLLTGNSNEKIQSDALKRARTFGLNRVDLFMMSFILERVAVAPFNDLLRLADWYRLWCQNFLAKATPPISLSHASKLAFDYAIRPEPLDHKQYVGTRSWELVHRHRSIKDFLVAFHVIETMRETGRGQAVQLNDLDYVYPHRITSFCKDLANHRQETQKDVLAGIKRVFREGGDRAKPNACYLAGRLTNIFVRTLAAEFLQECQREMAPIIRHQQAPLSSDQLLLARTIYISLAYLGTDDISRKASDEYLDWIMRDERWDDLNRGFHLEYYGDIDFDPDAQMSHRDPMTSVNEIAPCLQTVENLLKRIKAHFEDAEYGPLDIEVYTLYSLVQHRHSVVYLDPVLKDLALAEIPKLLSSKSKVSKRLRPYLQMLEKNLKMDRFPVMNIGEQLYGLKSVIREGWRIRHLTHERLESVSEPYTSVLPTGIALPP